MTSVRVLALTKYGPLGASSRVRFMQYLPWLSAAGVDVTVQSLLGDAALHERYRQGNYSLHTLLHSYSMRLKVLLSQRAFDLLWVEKEALPWWPLWAELALLRGVPFVLDYDDATFHGYDMHRLGVVKGLYGRRIDGLMAKAALVVGGNNYLAQRARVAGAPWVEVVPTVIDLQRYLVSALAKAPAGDGRPRVVWIGSPATAQYLQFLGEPLRALAQRVPFVLRVIGAGEEWLLPGIDVEAVPWADATEVADIAGADVGVMPLPDSPWERGKCGYKLIQYMACELPVVASPVGVNKDIVRNGVSGFLAESSQQWLDALERLLTNAQQRASMGRAGRTQVESTYCIQQTGPRMAELLTRAAQGV